nr:MAG TPA: hypothetical protein [Caudoviricetes sp.]
MYYINTQGPNHGNPTSTQFPNSVSLPDTLLMDYINTKGFCTLTVQDGAVTALVVDQEALDAYNAEHPEVEPEKPVTVEDLQAENKLLKEQVSALSTQADFHEECIVEMANIVYA